MTDWLLYKWNYKGQSAEFHTDMQYWNLLPVLSYTLLLRIRVRPADPSVPFHGQDRSHLNSLTRRLTNELSGRIIYAGSVSAPAEYCLFFYTDNPALLREALGIARGWKGFSVSAGIEPEPDFPTYYKFLCPDDARLQSIENEAFLKGLRMKDEERKLVHRMRMTAAFMKEEDREDFLNRVGRMGLIPGECFPGEKETHPACLNVYGYCTLSLEPLNALTERLICRLTPVDALLVKVECAD